MDRLLVLQGRKLLKVYLDDVRPCPDGWVLVTTPEAAIELLGKGTVEEISLDYDLGLDDMRSGYVVALWIEEQVHYNAFVLPKISLHTANPVGRARMEWVLRSIERMLKKRK